MSKTFVSAGLATVVALASGCTVTSYIPPQTQAAPQSYLQQAPAATNPVVPVSLNQAWDNIEAYSKERYRIDRLNKATSDMTLFVDAFDPASSITCGMVQNSGGTFDTHTEFLQDLVAQTSVNLDITVNVKLTAKSANETLVSVNAAYDLAVGFETNPNSGAIEGGSRYRFDSKGFAVVNAPGNEFAARCQPTGTIEAGIRNAAAGN